MIAYFDNTDWQHVASLVQWQKCFIYTSHLLHEGSILNVYCSLPASKYMDHRVTHEQFLIFAKKNFLNQYFRHQQRFSCDQFIHQNKILHIRCHTGTVHSCIRYILHCVAFVSICLLYAVHIQFASYSCCQCLRQSLTSSGRNGWRAATIYRWAIFCFVTNGDWHSFS